MPSATIRTYPDTTRRISLPSSTPTSNARPRSNPTDLEPRPAQAHPGHVPAVLPARKHRPAAAPLLAHAACPGSPPRAALSVRVQTRRQHLLAALRQGVGNAVVRGAGRFRQVDTLLLKSAHESFSCVGEGTVEGATSAVPAFVYRHRLGARAGFGRWLSKTCYALLAP